MSEGQIIDIPEIKVKTIEHRAEVKICPHCKGKNSASFPEELINTVQYGERLKVVAVYLTQYQLIPYKRSAELIEDLFNHHISQGSLVTFNQSCHDKLEPIENNIKKDIELNWNTNTPLPLAKIGDFEIKYDRILKAGFDEDYAKNIELYSKEKVKKSISLNLLNRLSGYKEQILAFMYDSDIPFDNNLAERDLRRAKVKQKISGTFTSSA